MKKIASLEFLNYKSMLQGVLKFISSVLESFSFNKNSLVRFQIACEEALLDRIKNAYDDEGMITVEISQIDSFFEVSIRDMGLPYWKDGSTYDPHSIGDKAEGLEDYLISNLADRFGQEKLGRNGQRTFLQIALKSPIELVANVHEDFVPQDFDISFKEVSTNHHEIIAAIQCIYGEYGYTYGYEALYYPENFTNLIKSGKLKSFLAVNAHGEIAGHYGLAFNDDYPNVPEWSTVVVKPAFRGHKVADKMLVHAIECAERSGCKAIFMQPVAYHLVTQRLSTKYGLIATGMLFQYINAELSSEYNKESRRLDLAIAVRILDKSETAKLFLPEELKPQAEKIYIRLGRKYEFGTPERLEQETVFKSNTHSLLKSCRVVILQCGEDVRQIIADITKTAYKSKLEMIEMLVCLSDSAFPFAYHEIVKEGFFASGFMPCGAKGDYLVMQNLLGSEVDTSKLVVENDFLEYVDYLNQTVEIIK